MCEKGTWTKKTVFTQEKQHSHVVLDEPLDFAAGEFVLCEFDGAVFKLVVKAWWAEQDNSSANKQRKGQFSPDRWDRPAALLV